MEWIQRSMETLLQISLSTAAVISVLLLLVPLWQRRYSARWRKVIWLVLAVRLLVPMSLELPRQPVQLDMDLRAATVWQSGQMAADGQIVTEPFMPATEEIGGQTAATQQPLAGEHDTSQATGQRTISRGAILAAIWLLGATGFLLWHGLQYGLFRHKALQMAQPLEDGDALLEQAAEGLQLRYLPGVVVSGAVQGPMLLGFRRPVILLPPKLYGERELSLILRHELTHHKLHDLWYKLLLLLANAVHWFNPLVWLMVRQAGRDVEQVCDEQVVQGQDLAYRKAYSMTILHAMADQRGIALSTSLSKQAQNGKKRFAAILYPRQTKKGVAALLAVVLLAVMASGCLQVGKEAQRVDGPINAIALYEQIAPWLPEGAVADGEQYTTRKLEHLGEIAYSWGEDVMAMQFSSQYAPTHEPQGLTIIADDETGQITNFAYWYDTEAMALPTITPTFWEEPEAGDAYLRQFAQALLPDGENLFFRRQDSGSAYWHYTALDERHHYRYHVHLAAEQGYISSFRREYYDTELRQQAYDWLQRQFHAKLGQHYQFSPAVAVPLGEGQRLEDDLYNWSMITTLYWRPEPTAQFQQQLEQLRQMDEAQYQLVADNMELLCEYVCDLQVQGAVGWNGKLKPSSMKLIANGPDASAVWTDSDWQRLDKALQLGWTAASYANAWAHHYPQAMALYGETDGVAFADISYIDGQRELVRSCHAAIRDYAGQQQYQVQVELTPDGDAAALHHLQMELEQTDGQWRVTSAELLRG